MNTKVKVTFPKVLHTLSTSISIVTFKFDIKRWGILQLISLLQGVLPLSTDN